MGKQFDNRPSNRFHLAFLMFVFLNYISALGTNGQVSIACSQLIRHSILENHGFEISSFLEADGVNIHSVTGVSYKSSKLTSHMVRL